MPFFCIFARLSAHFGEFLHYLKEERYMIVKKVLLSFPLQILFIYICEIIATD